MADIQLWEVVPQANDVKDDDGFIIGGQTAGTRYAPLSLFDAPSDNKTYGRKNGAWSEITSGGGGGIVVAGTIYLNVGAMKADTELAVGTIVQTAGFYSEGDGGGALYKIVDSATANDMDVLSLNNGFFAQAMLGGEAYPEQIGYYKDYSYTLDLTPYLTRLSDLGVTKILLTRCGGAPYCMKTTWNCGRPQIVMGANNIRSGYASRIVFRPSGSDKAMFHPTHQGFELHHIVLQYTLSDNFDGTICVLLDNENALMVSHVYEDLAIQKFAYGFKKTSIRLIWHFTFDKVFFSVNYVAVYLYGLIYLTEFNNCYFSGQSLYDVQLPAEPFTLYFNACNFSIQSPMQSIFKFSKYATETPTKFGAVEFKACNFELEGSSLPEDNHHLFFDIDDGLRLKLHLLGCILISTPLGRNDIFSDRLIHLGDESCITLENCNGPSFDIRGVDNFDMLDYGKFVFDENSTPLKEVGAITIKDCYNILLPELPSLYLPCCSKQVPAFDNQTNPLFNYNLKDGDVLQNLDNGGLYTKLGNSLRVVVEPDQNCVRVGNRLYSFVTINGICIITENLKWRTMDSRNYEIFGKDDFGVYYSQSDISKIEAVLPTGWRIPSTSDVYTLLGVEPNGRAGADFAHSIQSTNYSSVWGSATNSRGLSMVPSKYWYAPDATPSYNTGLLFVKSEAQNEIHNLTLTADDAFRGGWTPSEGGNLKLPVRIIKDA